MYLVNANEMREMDKRTIEIFGVPGRVLMENAGRGATRYFMENFHCDANVKVGIVAGRGNNGGDGFVMARYLFQKGVIVTVYLLSEQSKVKGDAASNLNLLHLLKVPVIEIPDKESFLEQKTSLLHQNILVDAILGTGLKSDVKGYYKEVIEFVNSSNKPVFAVDIPSGLNSDTGQPCGSCIHANATATFAFAKTGHLLFPGADFTGNLAIVDIGIPPHIVKEVSPLQHLITPELMRAQYQKRPPDAHKGYTGHLLVVAGSPGKTGAAAMTAISAMRAGAGLVTLGTPKSLNAVLETQVLEAMTFPLDETEDGMLDESSFDTILDLLKDKKCLAIGPGMGTADKTKNLVCRVIQNSTAPMVIDADGLNSLVGQTKILKDLKAPAILTPHPGEMSRLNNVVPGIIQKDRINYARDFARKFNVHLVLKGARTVIAHPDGEVFINTTGNSGMASGGMGDVLTGIIAGLVAQGYSPELASHMGVYLHGAAADALAKDCSPYGFLASDVMKEIHGQIGHLVDDTLPPQSVPVTVF